MKISEIPIKIYVWLANPSLNSNLDQLEKNMRKYYLWGQLGFLFFMLTYITGPVSSIPILKAFGFTGVLYWTITFLIFLFIKKIKYLLLATKLGMEAIVFYFVFHTGGILTCGGIILVGIAPVLYSLILRNHRWMIIVFSTYILSIATLLILNDQLPGKDIIPTEMNLSLYAITLVGITLYVFIFALYAQRFYTNMEQKETERQKEINEAKTRLYTNITHEFRTPLTVILGLADSLKTNSSETTHAKADTITRNGKTLLQLVDQMLDLSKLESGNLKVNKIHGNIVPFLRYIFQLQEYYAQEKDLDFSFNAESQSYELDFDPEKITTIVSNLLSNAIKFTPAGGKISMKVGTVGNYLSIEIIDNGIGITKEKQDKIFERFYQVDESDTRKVGGTGIGLALTKELVTLLNGTITLTSNPGNETVFTVKLPVTSLAKKVFTTSEFMDDESVDQHETVLPYPGNQDSWNSNGKRRLLIIEDNRDVVSYLQSCYQGSFSISIAVDGKSGYEMAIETIPDIIISDIMMPVMDGFSLCKKLKDDYRTSHIPIILLTAKADIPSRIQGLEQGADAYIVKPFNQQELMVRMNKLLELRRKLYQRYTNDDLFNLPSTPVTRREDQFMKKVTTNVQKHLNDENYDVHSLCEEMAMSKSQLYRKFKALTNMSAAKYIRKLRMQRARQLLLTTSLNITEVSYEVGMKTLSTFSEVFKDEFGQSPSEYQNHFNGKHRNN